MKKECTHTDNEAIEMMHKNTAFTLRQLANHFEKRKADIDVDWIICFLNEISDEQEAQSMVVALRDTL